MSAKEAVDEWLKGVGGKLSERENAEDCFVEVRRRYWKVEALEDLENRGISNYTDDEVEQLGEELWRQSLKKLENKE